MLTSSVGSVALTAGAADVSIQASTSVDDPAPGEPFTVTVNLSNVGNGSADVTDIYVRDSGGTEYARAEDLGTITAGGKMSVPVSVVLDDAGRKRLTVHAVVKGPDGGHTRVSYPVYVDVEKPDETAVSFEKLDPIAGDESSVEATVANGDENPISNVRLNLGGDAEIEDSQRVNASLPAGKQTSYTYNVTFPDSGEQTLNATVTYKTADGTTRTASFEKSTTVEAATVDADLTATVDEINGSSVIRTELTEYGNVDLTDVRLRALVDRNVVKRSLVSDVPAESTRTFTLNETDIPAGEMTVVAEYTAAGKSHTSNATLDYSPQEQSNVELTGIEATRAGSTLTLSGDAANLGSADANSVLVSVANANGVSPVSPNGEYFVGTVESSEFATFDLTANVNGSVDSLPVKIRYSANGEQFTRTVRVDISDSQAASGSDGAAASSGSGGSGGSDPPLMVIGAVLLVVVGACGIYWWRR
ncbi:Uncharacterized conserved protein [Halopelagius longus]|nr:Uncharacterized conserved protein [Halopelagius longus]